MFRRGRRGWTREGTPSRLFVRAESAAFAAFPVCSPRCVPGRKLIEQGSRHLAPRGLQSRICDRYHSRDGNWPPAVVTVGWAESLSPTILAAWGCWASKTQPNAHAHSCRTLPTSTPPARPAALKSGVGKRIESRLTFPRCRAPARWHSRALTVKEARKRLLPFYPRRAVC